MIAHFSFPLTLIIGFIILPLLCYVLCRRFLPKRLGTRIGTVCACILIALFCYGLTFGFEKLEIHHVEYVSDDLPEAFDGYRIVQFSDVHLGSYDKGRQWVMQQVVDSILAQKADMIVFTGDLINVVPSEILPFSNILRKLHAPDGVYSILGNHDYCIYNNTDKATKRSNCLLMQKYERQLGWTLLMNEHRSIHHGTDSIVLAGMENWGNAKRMPRQGNIAEAMKGIDTTAFVIMLQHDPSAWRKKILPESHAQLTLSGHTHGMQFGISGWSPLSFFNKEWGGMSCEGKRAMYISTGLGGLIPFRLGMPGEIAVITLKRGQKKL